MDTRLKNAIEFVSQGAAVFAENDPERRDTCTLIARLLNAGKVKEARANLRDLCTDVGTGHHAHDRLKIAMDRLEQIEEAPAAVSTPAKKAAKKKPAKKKAR